MLRAIIVEDSDDDTELLRRELVRGGFELVFERVQTAPDLEAAIRHCEWDIIFSDWTMPQFSAPRALEVVRQQELDIPFIIVSGTIGEDVAVEALRSGANDFFPKNRLTLLVPAVERELREAALRRERAQMQEQLVISDRMASIGILAAGIAILFVYGRKVLIPFRHCLALIAGGALGNLLDRLRSVRGVVDFIDVGIGDSRFWTFNVADSGVTCGAILLMLVLWSRPAPPDAVVQK